MIPLYIGIVFLSTVIRFNTVYIYIYIILLKYVEVESEANARNLLVAVQ